jgi:hypothetical protein
MSGISADGPIFSKDGQWVAYTSIPEGGWLPRFSRSNELFFVTMGNRLMVAEIAKLANFQIDSIRPLFQLDFPNFADLVYDISADGQRFVVLTADHTKSTSITLLTNWPAELKK